jgi:hypothetical protein
MRPATKHTQHTHTHTPHACVRQSHPHAPNPSLFWSERDLGKRAGHGTFGAGRRGAGLSAAGDKHQHSPQQHTQSTCTCTPTMSFYLFLTRTIKKR